MKVFKQIWVNSRNINVIGKAVLKGSEKNWVYHAGKKWCKFQQAKMFAGEKFSDFRKSTLLS